VTISAERLEQFLESEITTFALRQPEPVKISQILQKPGRSVLKDMAEIVHQEIPVRFAARIKQLETLPGWEEIPEIAEIRNIFATSFKSIRMVRPDSPDFIQVIKDLKERHALVVPTLSMGIRHLLSQHPNDLSEDFANDLLNRFFFSRIGTEMLTSQFLALHHSPTGIVDRNCDPVRVCELAAKSAQSIASTHFGSSPKVHVSYHGPPKKRTFVYIPTYLYYVINELLKNALRATVEHHRSKGGRDDAFPNVEVIVSCGQGKIAIQISDRGGGIPFEDQKRVWSYMYTTATGAPQQKTAVQQDEKEQEVEIETANEAANQHTSDGGQRRGSHSWRGTPLAGYGVGLPLSRLYSQYLTGSLDLVSLPNYGTHAFLFLSQLPEFDMEEVLQPEYYHMGPTSLSSLYSVSDPSNRFLGSSLSSTSDPTGRFGFSSASDPNSRVFVNPPPGTFDR